VILSATHTHSSPGGYAHDGTLREAYFDAVVSGITDAIEAAHQDLQPGRILVGQRVVEDAGANRSAVAYRQNPEAERARYENDTDEEMTLLKLERADGVIGVLSWFAVHPTSLTFNNSLVSADHKGFAAVEMEKRFQARADTTAHFAAAFAQGNCGDVTGNLNLDNTGPGVDDYDSARIIGQRQLDAAMKIFESPADALSGGVDYRLAAVDFTDLEVADDFTGAGPQRTCFPAYGYSFAGGSTEDGGGHPLFVEGMLEREESIETLVQLVLQPPPVTDELRECHLPKPILYPKAQQDPLPIGVARVGQLAMVLVPSEVTTMSGRRMRDTVKSVLGDEVKYVVIAGYSKDQGDLRGVTQSIPLGNEYDEPPSDASFGELIMPPQGSHAPGDAMSVSFWTGHPDNVLRREDPYVEVQRLADADWATVATESDWSTQLRWTQANRTIPPYDPLDPFATPPPPINEAFTVSIIWKIPADADAGTYRVIFHGSEKQEAGSELRSFIAESPSFQILSP
jgi:neutral ceramidase